MESESTNQNPVDESRCVNIALIDLECTCNNDDTFGPHEIIEIGAILGKISLQSFEVIGELQIYVKPTINPTLTNFCTDLTGITQDTVDAAATLDNALPVFQSWLQKDNVKAWGSWGKFDANQFERECSPKGFKNPFGEVQHLNIKQLFARRFGHRVGITRALDLRGLQFEGRLHSGLNDTRNIVRLVGAEPSMREALLTRII